MLYLFMKVLITSFIQQKFTVFIVFTYPCSVLYLSFKYLIKQFNQNGFHKNSHTYYVLGDFFFKYAVHLGSRHHKCIKQLDSGFELSIEVKWPFTNY